MTANKDLEDATFAYLNATANNLEQLAKTINLKEAEKAMTKKGYVTYNQNDPESLKNALQEARMSNVDLPEPVIHEPKINPNILTVADDIIKLLLSINQKEIALVMQLIMHYFEHKDD